MTSYKQITFENMPLHPSHDIIVYALREYFEESEHQGIEIAPYLDELIEDIDIALDNMTDIESWDRVDIVHALNALWAENQQLPIVLKNSTEEN
jgi:hypothetical protein